MENDINEILGIQSKSSDDKCIQTKAEKQHQKKILYIGRLSLGIAVVVLFYIGGSALHWSTGAGRFTDFRLPQHLASLFGFIFAACLAKRLIIVHMILVFGVSYILCGLYEDVWRQLFWGSGYIWDYHWWTLQFWAVAFIIGTVIGRVFYYLFRDN